MAEERLAGKAFVNKTATLRVFASEIKYADSYGVVECAFCATPFEVDIDRNKPYTRNESDGAKDMFESGWRYISSQKYQSEGIACKDCVAEIETE